MWVDYIDLNRVCPKDSYMLPNIEKLVHKLTFMIKQANYKYKVMPFVMKNVGVTYQIFMNMVFR